MRREAEILLTFPSGAAIDPKGNSAANVFLSLLAARSNLSSSQIYIATALIFDYCLSTKINIRTWKCGN
jgi:hypothetical protein